jgi:hypothetical protein
LGEQIYTTAYGDTCSFKFYGTKLRIITAIYTNQEKINNVIVDGVIYSYNAYSGTLAYQILLLNLQNLDLGVHNVIITKGTNDTSNLIIDAIDIDDTGYLLHPILNQVSDINTMQVGDCIPCRYTATTSGSAGYFSELGTCITNEISISGTAVPDGLFYLIKTKKGMLIADRIVQTNISWDTLNSAKFIEGCKLIMLIHPPMTSNNTPTPYEVSSDGNTGAPSTQIYTAFDLSTTGTSYFDNSSGTVKASYIQIKLANKTDMNCVRILPYYYSGFNTGNFHIEGSNDGTNWVSLSSNFTIADKTGWVTIDLPQIYSYQYYRLKRDINTTAVILYEIEFSIKRYFIRSLSGGCAYADANGNMSLTDKSLGAWPPNNEWDKYIVNSDLKGKIIKGNDDIWHWKSIGVLCKDTPTNGMKALVDAGITYNNTHRIFRGYNDNKGFGVQRTDGVSSSQVFAAGGFRPVLNYVETDIASEVI